MPPSPRQFFSDSATQIPNDIDFARSFHHPVSAAAQQLSDSRVPGGCPFFRWSPGPANSVPDLSAGLSAAPIARQSHPRASVPRPELQLPFSRTIQLSRVDRSCHNNNRIEATTCPNCSGLSPEGRSPLPAFLAHSAPADRMLQPRRELDSRKVNQGKSVQSESAAQHASRRPWPEGRRCRPPAECKRYHPCCSPGF